ncbi:MAG: glycosyltransferase family 4 protein, partial [Longimicrobiales bacterium]|nr:glycosyltransferase family 4 protein [Longimicrobiales bacterium]
GRPLSIVMHCVYFPPEVGGLESHVFHLCRALVQMGHRVAIVTSRSLPGLPRHEIIEGVEVHRTWFPARHPLGWGLHAICSTPRTARLARDADILHAQAFASVFPILMARGGARTPVVTTWHTSHFLVRAESALWRPLFERMLRSVDHNLAASTEIAHVGESIAPGIRVEALTNGVDTERFGPGAPALPTPGEGRRRLIVPRRLFSKNGVEFAVRALPLIAKCHDVEVVFVGDGPERARLEALAGELGVADRVRFLGRRPNPEMPGLLRSAELAIFPSLMEATSVAALECLACEVPVAASRVGGLPEIIDDTVGGLFEPADPVGLAARVSELLDDPALADRGREGRRRVVARWSNRRLAERHLALYRSLLVSDSTRPIDHPELRS